MRNSLCIGLLFALFTACGNISPATQDGGTGGATGSGGAPGTGGKAGGSGGQGGTGACAQLEANYAAALTAGKECSPGTQNQCQKSVTSRLGCGGCETFVNDDSTLSQIQNTWNQNNCGSGIACPLIACVPPTSAVCTASDAGGGTCVDQ